MKNLLTIVCVLGLVASPSFAQQPNTPGVASMVVNNFTGSSYPITAVPLPRGATQTVVIEGAANAPFVLFGSPNLLTPGYAVPSLSGQILDVDLSAGFGYVLDGFTDPSVVTNANGTYILNAPLSATTALNTTAAFQTLIASLGVPAARFTAATSVVVTPGLTVIPITTAANPGGGTAFNLSTYGLSFPFYANTYSTLYVHADGFISFGSAVGDFTPTPAEFRGGAPRIAAMWTDLEPQYAGAQVNVTIDESLSAVPFTTATVNWINMAEWSDAGSRHTFAARLTPLTGDIQLNWDAFNNAMVYDEFVGITPGNNLLPPAPNNQWPAQADVSDFNINPYLAAPNEAIWEWFGLTTMTYYTPNFNNPWDLAGRTVGFTAISPGMSGASYFAQ